MPHITQDGHRDIHHGAEPRMSSAVGHIGATFMFALPRSWEGDGNGSPATRVGVYTEIRGTCQAVEIPRRNGIRQLGGAAVLSTPRPDAHRRHYPQETRTRSRLPRDGFLSLCVCGCDATGGDVRLRKARARAPEISHRLSTGYDGGHLALWFGQGPRDPRLQTLSLARPRSAFP